MKRFDFRLERVRTVRRIQAERERAELLRVRGVESAARRHLDASRERAGREGTPTGGPTETLLGQVFTGRVLADAVVLAADTHRDAQTATSAQARRFFDAQLRVDALDRLAGRHREAWAHDVRREEARVLDDLAAARRRFAPTGLTP